MKLYKHFLVLAVAGLSLQSCLDDDNDYDSTGFPNALVTVKSTDDNKTYFQLDESTTLYPENLNTQLYDGKHVRALMNFSEIDKQTPGYTKTVRINWIDSIRTKDMVLLSETVTDQTLGCDPIELVRDWVTIAEDGYLTLRVRTVWGDPNKVHYLNLLGNVNPENPFEVELRHNASGDTHGSFGDALIAFRLSELPVEIPDGQLLTVKWKSFNGTEKKASFKMSAGAAVSQGSPMTDELATGMMIK